MDEGERIKNNVEPPSGLCWNEQMQRLRLFDQLIENTDRNLGNVVISRTWRIWAIDHARAFRHSKGPPKPANLTRVDRRLLQRLAALEFETLKRQVRQYLDDDDLRALLSRRDAIMAHCRAGVERMLYDRQEADRGCVTTVPPARCPAWARRLAQATRPASATIGAMAHTLLFCFAHPDDESFSGAGTAMRSAALAGARSVLVTATLGERGKRGAPAVCTAEELPACRERELREAVRIIGIDELHLLRYRDRELADAPPADMRAALVAVLRRERPSVVFTFDPNGFNVHPDHIAISRFTTDAIAAAADPRWLPEAGTPYLVPRLLWTPVHAPWEPLAADGTQPGADFVIDTAAWRERKAAALRAHRSQHLSIDRCFFNQPDLERILSTETWRQAWGPALDRRPESSIFAGL